MANREAVLEIKAALGGDKISYEDAEMVTDLAIKGVTDAINAMTRTCQLQAPNLMIQTALVMNKLMEEAIKTDTENFREMLNDR